MFVPILTDMFNNWFAQEAIPNSVTKGMITLLKKGSRHVWKKLDDYRPITLLNTELKILARVLANRLQFVISDLIGPEQNYAVKGGGSIQDNLHLVREIRERLEVVQVNGKRSRAFAIERSVRQSCPLSLLLYVLALEPLLHRLKDGKASQALRGIPFAGSLSAKVSAYADDITVFVYCRLDIKAVKKVVSRYEQISGAKINFDKSEALQLGACRSGVPLPLE